MITSNLRKIDLYALKYFNSSYSFEDFVKEKEMKTNMNVSFLNKRESDISDEEFDLGPSDDEEKINKLVSFYILINYFQDLDKAYEMYLLKKKQIMKLYDERKGEEDR